MLESGDWVVPRLLDDVRTAKPIFIYWCQASAMKLLGPTAFAARLPSALGMLGTLVVLAIVIHKTDGPQLASHTLLILASAGLSIAAAKMCLTDAVLLLFITGSQICLCILYCGGAKKTFVVAMVMWIAIGFAVLTKGPVVLGVQLMTLLVLAIADRKIQPLKFWIQLQIPLGILIVVLICGPWAYLIHQREPTFFQTIIGHDVINRVRNGLEGHKGPPGYYLLTIWGTFFPWSLLLPATIVHAWKHRGDSRVRFALAAVFGPWIMFEIVQTKLPHYMLPTFPALAYLTANMLQTAAREKWFADKTFQRVTIGWGIIVLLISFAPWLARLQFPDLSRLALAGMILLPIVAFEYVRAVYLHFRAARPADAAIAMGVGMFAIILLLFTLYLPNADYLRISPNVAAILREHGATDPGKVLMIDYKEDSLAFYQGGTIRKQRDNRFLETNPPDAWPAYLVITEEIWRKTPLEIRHRFDLLGSARGLSYADGGRILTVLVLRKRNSIEFAGSLAIIPS
jgi:4-amino-4-deoxy-L-arabinose transferase-like glycosyltransferase